MNVNDIPDDPTSCANPSYECGPLPDEQTGCVSGTGSICSNHLNLQVFRLVSLSFFSDERKPNKAEPSTRYIVKINPVFLFHEN